MWCTLVGMCHHGLSPYEIKTVFLQTRYRLLRAKCSTKKGTFPVSWFIISHYTPLMHSSYIFRRWHFLFFLRQTRQNGLNLGVRAGRSDSWPINKFVLLTSNNKGIVTKSLKQQTKAQRFFDPFQKFTTCIIENYSPYHQAFRRDFNICPPLRLSPCFHSIIRVHEKQLDVRAMSLNLASCTGYCVW